MTGIRRLGLALALALLATSGADASESSSELAIGGLAFGGNPSLTVESEDLTLTPETVRIRYAVRNTGTAPVTVAMTFPFPDLDFSDPDESFAIPGSQPVNFVDFATSVDGRAVPFTITQRATVNGKDVTAALRQVKLNLVPIGDFANQLDGLDPATRERLVGSGALVQTGTDVSGRPLLTPGWVLHTVAIRPQTFAAGQLVTIDHRYRTSLGARQDTALRRPLRTNDSLKAELDRYRADFCVDDSLLNGVDRLAGLQDANAGRLGERRMVFALKSGPAPVGAFHLVVDKGKPDRLVSFCINGLTKISPTAFEMRAQNFSPDSDLKVLLIGRF